MKLVTSHRMYNAAPGATAAWRALFERVFRDVGVEAEFIPHGFPTPIDELWREPGLFGAFMCGWPFTRADRAMQAIAAPVPSPARYGGEARYRSEFLARAASGYARLEDTFGARIGWMARDSQSGFNAPRHLLSQRAKGRALYAESKGPYVTPMRTLEALAAQEVDVVALDCFFLDLLRRHAPEKMDGLATIAETPWTPMPLLVAAPEVDPAKVDALREHLLSLGKRADYAPLLEPVLLSGFAAPNVEAYEVLGQMAFEAVDAGYPDIR